MSIEAYLSLVDRLLKKLKEQSDVEGILLFGSVAEGKIAKRSDIDMMIMVQDKRPYYKDLKFIDGIWVEQFFQTYKGLKDNIETPELAHVYMFKDGKILYDPQGKISELKQIAIKMIREYKPSEEELKKKRFELQSFIDDLLDMLETGDLNTAIFYMYDNQYFVFYTLYTINNRFLPKFKDIFKRIRELSDKPTNFDQLLDDIFMAYKPEKRLESFLELANWELQRLGGRLAEVKE